MNDAHLWRTIAWGYFLCINLCVVILVEMIVLGFPYISLFLLIFAATIKLNMRLLKK